ncbi:MAG: hypothetical protein CMM58_03790 [Rhodospirillaceae bacterium]|nr:hypothetical protein [Rhodospirillaceae bacterium]
MSNNAIDELIVLYHEGNFQEALVKATSLAQKFPDNILIPNILAAANASLGRYKEAVAYYYKAIELDPSNADTYNNLGVLQKQHKNYSDSSFSYRSALILRPDFADSYYNLGNVLGDLGRDGESLTSFMKATQLKPIYPEAFNNMGLTLNKIGQNEHAITCLYKAIDLEPKYVGAHNNLANLFQKLGKHDEAITYYNKTIKLEPNYSLPHNNLGNSFAALEQFEKAKASYLKAIGLNPCYPAAQYNQANTLVKLGHLEEAIYSYNKALQLKPDYIEAFNNKGDTLFKFGREREAITNFKKAVTLNPQYSVAYNNLGTVYTDLVMIEDAATNIKKAIMLQPDYSEARYNLGIALYTIGQYQEAEELFRTYEFSKSQHYLLGCLYFRDAQSLFYKLLDYLIDREEVHPMIGSLCSQAEIKYGKTRRNLFCKDPLAYVSKVDLNERYNFEQVFVQGAKSILDEDNLATKKQMLLTNGYQTAGNLFLRNNSVTGEIEKIIRSEINNYYFSFADSEEGFIKHWPTAYNLDGWLISMKNGGALAPHIHEKGWISGSIYINVPPKVKANSGNLVVCVSGDELSEEANNTQKTINVVTGSLCLFPASLFHYTIPFESDEDRIVLAFDMAPE